MARSVEPTMFALALSACSCSAEAKRDDPAPATVPIAAKAVVDELQAAKGKQAEVQARQLLSAVQMHILQTNACPVDVQALATAKVIAEVPRDPWGADYVLECRDGGASVVVISVGADGKRGTDDDILVETHEF